VNGSKHDHVLYAQEKMAIELLKCCSDDRGWICDSGENLGARCAGRFMSHDPRRIHMDEHATTLTAFWTLVFISKNKLTAMSVLVHF
jgi:hypothetical protein